MNHDAPGCQVLEIREPWKQGRSGDSRQGSGEMGQGLERWAEMGGELVRAGKLEVMGGRPQL